MDHRWKFKLFGQGECYECGEKAFFICQTHGEKLCPSDYRKLIVGEVKTSFDAARLK